jgi:hypothetical protein
LWSSLRIADHSTVIAGCIGAGHIEAVVECAQLVPINRKRFIALQLGTHGLIDLSAAVVVKDIDGVFGLRRIVLGNRRDALIGAENLRHPTLLGELSNALFRIVASK